MDIFNNQYETCINNQYGEGPVLIHYLPIQLFSLFFVWIFLIIHTLAINWIRNFVRGEFYNIKLENLSLKLTSLLVDIIEV